MDLFFSSSVREADRIAMEDLGIPGIILMENAANRILEVLLREFKPGKISILTGSGNNGGDGHALARLLASKGISTITISAVREGRLSGDGKLNFELSKRIGSSIVFSETMSDDAITEMISSSDILVDALLGTGSKGEPRGEISRLIKLATRCQTPVISVDIPSGIDPDGGHVYSPCIRAVATVSMLACKTGLMVMPAAEMVGKLHLVDIGVPVSRVLKSEARAFSVERDFCAAKLPSRNLNIHKGQRGAVLIAGGSRQYKGATALVALGVLRSGSGLVFSLADEEVEGMLGTLLPEAISLPLPVESGRNYAEILWEETWRVRDRTGCCVIGPGYGRLPGKMEALSLFWENWTGGLLVDGDGLYCMSCTELDKLERRTDAIITPHEGEAARLLGISADEVRSDRLGSARQLATRWGICVLKGAYSIIDDGIRTAVITEGHPCLSVAGSGDVLSGIISSFLAAGCEPFESACLGSWIHARSGTLLGERRGYDGVLARDIAEMVPEVLKELREKDLSRKEETESEHDQ